MIEGHAEVGKFIPHSELVEKQVVVLSGGDDGPGATVWVYLLADEVVLFWAGEADMMLVLVRRDDGKLEDSSGNVVDVQAFLGEV